MLNAYARNADAADRAQKVERHHRRRTAQDDRRAHRAQPEYVRPRNAAMQRVSNDDDALACQIADMIADRHQIEQRLRRVRVPSIARIDHPKAVEVPRQEVRCAGVSRSG